MKKIFAVLAVLVIAVFSLQVNVSAFEQDGDLTYVNVDESDYWILQNGNDSEGNPLEWGFYEAEAQYGGVQLFAYGYPQDIEEPEEGWVMPAATFSFKGTYVGVISVPGNDQGWMDIYIDGEYQITIRSIDYEAEDSDPVWEDINSILLWSIDDLEDTVHTITVTPTKNISYDEDITWSKCNVDAIVIKGEPVKASEVEVPELRTPDPTPTPERTDTPKPANTATPTKTPEKTASATSPAGTDAVGDGEDASNMGIIIAVIAICVVAVAVVIFVIVKKNKK